MSHFEDEVILRTCERAGPASKLGKVMASQSSANNFQTKTLPRFGHALHFMNLTFFSDGD